MPTTPRGPVAEWQPQTAVALAWPPLDSDWRDDIGAIRSTYLELIRAITAYQTVWLLHRPEEAAALRDAMQLAGIDTARVECLPAAFDDTWLRDTSPLTLHQPDGLAFVSFAFDGWGGKYPAQQDAALGDLLLKRLAGQFDGPQRRVDLVAEGGALESDGCGRVLTTRRWLDARYPGDDAAPETLRQTLQARELLVIENGWLAGDDTDGHIDNLVRLVARDRLVYQQCAQPDEPAAGELQAMAEQVEGLRTAEGEPYQCFALPWPGRIAHQGRQLAASYANFLIINGAVLVPQFNVTADAQAIDVMTAACPDRDIIGIDARALIRQNGGIHCASMQFPLPPD